MIGVSVARELIRQHALAGRSEKQPLLFANGCLLAENVYAPIDTPPFHQSAMDGYAFSFDSWDGSSPLKVAGEVQAGSYSRLQLHPMQAIRIFTGAPVPAGADTVVMQEKVIVNNDFISISDPSISKGANVRKKGSQNNKGDLVLQAGQLLTPAGLAYLAGMGIKEVSVYTKPMIHIITTGKELINDLKDFTDGKIFESNSIGLIAALQKIGIQPASVVVTDDDEKEIMNAVQVSKGADFVLLTGGVSVGEYDLVAAAMEKCGVQKIFHSVKQKPGKPLYFGKKNNTLFFGLPGNPASTLTCFYEYVMEAIEIFLHVPLVREIQLPLQNGWRKKSGLTFFLKGKTKDNGVEILGQQESFMMSSFAISDCLVELDENREQYEPGDMVRVKMII
jgi:molybdopterin molybdotransferase